jgi:hypothetical protein
VRRRPTHLRRVIISDDSEKKNKRRERDIRIRPTSASYPNSLLQALVSSATPPVPHLQTPHSHSYRLRKTQPRYPPQLWQRGAKQRATSPSTVAPISHPHPRLRPYPSPAALPSFDPQRQRAFGLFKVHVQKGRFSRSYSGIMPYDWGLSDIVVTGRLSRNFKGSLVN